MSLTETIDAAFKRYGIQATIVGQQVSSRVVRYQIKLLGSQRIRHLQSFCDELSLALNVASVRVVRSHSGGLYLEVGQSNFVPVQLDKLLGKVAFKRFGGVTGLLGVTIDNDILLINLASPDVVHMLISGTTGSGKTELLKAFVQSLITLNDLHLIVIDPKGEDFQFLKGNAALQFPVQTTVDLAILQLEWVADQMVKHPTEIISPLVLVIDELADFLMFGGDKVQINLSRILQRGRSVGIHVVAATQKPLSNLVGSVAKSNFPVRVVGKVASTHDSFVASGLSNIGAERLQGKGDFLLVYNGEAIRFQGAIQE